MRDTPFQVRAPGRVCLFGEHSDYIGLDVIAAAINMTINISARPREDNIIHILYSDLGAEDEFVLDREIPYRNKRDYFRSAFNVLARKETAPEHGWDLDIRGNIPIAAGLSSSSALTVAAVMTVAKMAHRTLTEKEVALIAHQAEVVEFGESGGTMDHYASAFGGIIHIDMETGHVNRLPAKLGSLVIGDSGEKKKNTVGDLRLIKTNVEKEYQSILDRLPSFNRRTTPLSEIDALRIKQHSAKRTLAESTLRNRDLTSTALDLLNDEHPDPVELGTLLNRHHEILREGLHRSTPKIELMIDAALRAGALGCKINGSGGGGTMMAYCRENEEEIASKIERVGGRTYIAHVDRGASISSAN